MSLSLVVAERRTIPQVSRLGVLHSFLYISAASKTLAKILDIPQTLGDMSLNLKNNRLELPYLWPGSFPFVAGNQRHLVESLFVDSLEPVHTSIEESECEAAGLDVCSPPGLKNTL